MKVFAKIAYGLAWWKFPVRGQERGGAYVVVICAYVASARVILVG